METGTLVMIKHPEEKDGKKPEQVHLALYPSESGDRSEGSKCKPGDIGTVVKTQESSTGIPWCMILMRTGLSGWLTTDEVEPML
jgi:hypothetical protein